MTAALLTLSVVLLAPAADPPLEVRQRVDHLVLGTPDDVKEARTLLEKMQTASRSTDLHYADTQLYIRWRQAWCQYQLGQPEEAQGDLEKTIQDVPEGRNYFLFPMNRDLGEWYLSSRKMDKAKAPLDAALKAALVLAPTRADAQRKGDDFLTAYLRLSCLRARYLAFLHENDEAQARLSEVAAQVEEDSRRIADAGRRIPPGLTALSVECGFMLAELDRRALKMPQAIGRLRRCLDDIQSDKSGWCARLLLEVRILLANAYWESARYEDAEAQLDHAGSEATHRTDAQESDLKNAWASEKVEKITSALERRLEDATILKEIQRAEGFADEAIRCARKGNAGPNTYSAEAEWQLAQLRGMRGRFLAAAGMKKKARAAFDQAKGDCDDALKDAPEQDLDLTLHLKRYRAWVNLQRGDVKAAREEAEASLDQFANAHPKDHVDCELFYDLLLQIEEQAATDARDARNDKKAAECAKKAADWADKHRGLTPQRVAFLTGLTAPVQIKFFQDNDEPALHGGLRLGVAYESLHERSAEWLINGKARIAEATAQVYKQARERMKRGGGDEQEFQKVIRRQAFRLYGPPAADEEGRRLQLDGVDELESKKRDLAANAGGLKPLLTPQVKLADFRLQLAPEDLYIDVCRLRPQRDAAYAYYAWVVARDGPVSVVELGDATEIDALVMQFQIHQRNCPDRPGKKGLFSELGPDGAEAKLRTDCLDRLSFLLLTKLLPLADGKPGKTHWIVSPDAQLWNVPWAALVLPGTDTYAVEKYSFRYVISGRDLRAPPAAVAIGKPWVVADPDLDLVPKGFTGALRPEGSRMWVPRLPHAAEEGQAIAAYFKPTTAVLLTGAQATKDEYLHLDPPPSVIYLSTHGFFFSPPGLRSDDRLRVDPLLCCGVAFAGSNFLPDGKTEDSQALPGWLTGAEVLSVNLSGTELVVLAACESGTGETQDGQSPADLRDAFHLAGARMVASSLWEVDNDATRALMDSFMKTVRDPKADKAEALAKAQREMIATLRAGTLSHAHPFFWAAFTLSGY